MTPRSGSQAARRSRWRVAIDRRLSRIPRYRAALLESMARFGRDFDLDAFVAAYESEDPADINAVTALEGDLGHIVNWVKQIADYGYHELVRLDRIAKSDGRPLDGLVEAGVLRAADRDRIDELVELRNRMQHDYPGVLPPQVHAAARLLIEALPALMDRYAGMLRRIDA